MWTHRIVIMRWHNRNLFIRQTKFGRIMIFQLWNLLLGSFVLQLLLCDNYTHASPTHYISELNEQFMSRKYFIGICVNVFPGLYCRRIFHPFRKCPWWKSRLWFLPEALLAYGYCHCLRLCVCVCLSVCQLLLVRMITRHPFKLGSPNLNQKMQNILLQVPIVLGAD